MINARTRTPLAAPFIVAAVTVLFAGLAPTIASPAPPELTDVSVADAVEDRLYMDPAVPANRIEATATDGIVTLSGVVSSILAKERAARLAETVKGVRGVVNTIAVFPGEPRKPVELKKDIVAALDADPATDAWEIVPEVGEGGVVILTGTVESWAEAELAAKVAKGVKGVTELENNIVVEPAVARSDEDIRADVEQSLRWDALVDHAEIGVTVEDAVVRLAGTVGSAAEWRRARMHSWTAGVTSVDNSQLVVAKWTRDPTLRESKHQIKAPEEIVRAVRRALELDPRIDASKVDTSLVAGMVTLRGTVDSVRAKRAAAENARNTVGVNDVLNRLQVRPEGEKLGDAELATRVRDALLRDPYVARFDVAVTVVNGVAHLEGVVDSNFEKLRADTVASGVNGVVEVENALTVTDDDQPYSQDPYVDEASVDWHAYRRAFAFTADAAIKSDIEKS
jgi:osmotically-inducible protein OsmY